MSVEISGPKGYEFQYLITAYMVISNLEEKKLKVIVEKEDGEDFEISFERENKSYIIESQVKSTADDLSLKKLVSWLHHFADNSSNNNLISRIENDENRYALFITKGRCTDETKYFISKQFVAHNDAIFKRGELSNYLGHISTLFTGSTKLQKERREYSELQKEKFNSNRPLLTSLLRKTIIQENIDENNIIEEIYKILKQKFNIPIVKCEDVLLKVLEAVRKARSHRGDVVPEVIEIIQTNKINVISTGEVNIERGLENPLLGKIKENNYLLLTGISFCGKTHMARQIAKKYQQYGYHYKEVSDVNDAKRFLLEESSEERLCIVEDPLGHMKLKEEASEIWSQLADLITKINSNRLLIITSKIEMIKEFNGAERLEDCSLEGGEWIDLTVSDKEFLLKVWKGYLDYNGLSEDLFERIRGIIKNQDKAHLLQPGQIRYLSLQGIDEHNYTDDEIIRIATIDAQKIGNYFNSLPENYKLIIYVLGLGATTLDSINIRELSYILGDVEEYPSSGWEDSAEFSEIEFDNDSIDFPVYSSELPLEDVYYNSLYYLETKGYIKKQDENYVFSHPTFQYAAQFTLSRTKERSQEKRLLEIIKKGLSCLDDRIAINFINKFDYLYENCRREIPKSLDKYAERCLRSIFPAVRDEALIFLLKIFESLNPETQKKVHNYLQTNFSPEDNIKWNMGQPWILEKTHYNLFDMKDFFIQKMPVPIGEYNRIREKVTGESLYNISVRDIWNFVKSIENFTDNISEDAHLLIKVFKSNESFIRANIARILMENIGYYQGIREIVLNDPHPSVLYQGVRGIFIGWKNFDEQSKLFLTNKLEELFNDSSVSIVSIHFMIDFGDEYGFDSIHQQELSDSERVDVWNLWAKLFAVFFRSISNSLYLNDSHLYNTIIQASKILETPKFIPIIDAWLVWIEKKIENNKLLSGSALGVARPLLENSRDNHKAREHISEKLLSCKDTNFIAITLSDYINNWDLLSDTEKEIIIRLFENDKRVDKEWLKAISLTRRYVPTEIQKVISGEDILNKDPQLIISNMDDQLLLKCLNIYLGYPQPLWWIGTHHEIDTPWSDILITLLIENKTEHLGYIIALRNFIEQYSRKEYPNKNKGYATKIWKVVCGNSNLYDEIFELLLMWSRKIVGVNVIGLWEIFFELCPGKKDEEYLSIIVENAVILNDRNHLYEIFGENIFFNKIFPNLKSDYLIYNILNTFIRSKQLEEPILENLTTFIKSIYEAMTPLTNITDRFVEFFYKKYSHPNKEEYNMIVNLINKRRQELLEEARKEEDKLEDDYELEGWNY